MIASTDQIINHDLGRVYYEREKSTITVIEGASHAFYEFHARGLVEVRCNGTNLPKKDGAPSERKLKHYV